MSATQTTTNYGLPIFIESDKPAWLVDFNGAMRSIDAQMKTNADAIATKSPILTFADTSEIELNESSSRVTANLSSDIAGQISRSLIKPTTAPATDTLVNIDTTNNQRNLAIGKGLHIIGNVIETDDFTLSNTGSVTSFTSPLADVSITGTFSYALNADKTIGKLYGYLKAVKNTSGAATIEFDTGITVANAAAEEYRITNSGISNDVNTYRITNPSILITATGAVKIRAYVYGNTTTDIRFFPCMLIFTSFGDIE